MVAGGILTTAPASAAVTALLSPGSASSAGNPTGRAPIPRAGRAVSTAHPDHVVGHGSPAGCTSAAVVRAVKEGGETTFNCGPGPVTIVMKQTAKVVNTSHRVVLDGGGLVTLSGASKREILYQDTCDRKQIWTTPHCDNQRWPELIVQNLTFAHGYSPIRQRPGAAFGGGGGGAIFAEGGQLRVVNDRFTDNRCYQVGPDLGGAAIRALEQWKGLPVYVTRSTFTGGRCSNGSGLSSIGVSWRVIDSLFVNNFAIGHGANPASSGTPGGGSGGAIYTDGDTYSVVLDGTVIRNGHAKAGGGAIFFVSDDNTGTLTIKNSTLTNNPSAGFWTRPYPGIFFKGKGHPRVTHSTLR
jgi:hypothetical protein